MALGRQDKRRYKGSSAKPSKRRAFLKGAAGVSAIALTGCENLAMQAFTSSPAEAPRSFRNRNPIPQANVAEGTFPGFNGIRFFADRPSVEFSNWFTDWASQRQQLGLDRGGLPIDALTLSGGSSEGAFGAGLLVGWGQRGDRPKFNLVCGISAGALIASSVATGSDYDMRLVSAFRSNAFSDLVDIQPTKMLFGGESASSADKLFATINRMVTNQMIDQIAVNYRKGSRFLVLTTNLDLQRPVAWDITAIAASGHHNRYHLVRSLLMATTALPGLFPPVRLPVEANNTVYDELHVDGAVSQGLFLLPGAEDSLRTTQSIAPNMRFRIWMVINGSLTPSYSPVNAQMLQLANKSLETLLKRPTSEDVEDLFEMAQEMQTAGRVTFVPNEITQRGNANGFDKTYMRQLFRYGLARGKQADYWFDRLP